MTKTQAQAALSAILLPLNAANPRVSQQWTLGDFVKTIYLPFYRRKWKRTTARSNEYRIRQLMLPKFQSRLLTSFRREELQTYLDVLEASGSSYSVVAHVRWDLNQVFKMAVSEEILARNPAELLFVPRDCPRPATRALAREEVRTIFQVLAPRERLIVQLAIMAGMRPGEIFALKWSRLEAEYADVRQRVYRGDVDSPKSHRSLRWAALSDGVLQAIRVWKEASPLNQPDDWVFPSEKGTTPLSKDNCWRRHVAPQLKAVGLAWVNFQVMRRTHATLMNEVNDDPKIVADQLGHNVDVSLNVYTKTALARRRKAVNQLETSMLVQ